MCLFTIRLNQNILLITEINVSLSCLGTYSIVSNRGNSDSLMTNMTRMKGLEKNNRDVLVLVSITFKLVYRMCE